MSQYQGLIQVWVLGPWTRLKEVTPSFHPIVNSQVQCLHSLPYRRPQPFPLQFVQLHQNHYTLCIQWIKQQLNHLVISVTTNPNIISNSNLSSIPHQPLKALSKYMKFQDHGFPNYDPHLNSLMGLKSSSPLSVRGYANICNLYATLCNNATYNYNG